ncbi:Pyridinium-3,5-bisthiocarboxylic acid mononucleotide nickel insertion protein [Paenibacillus solanacearum]|uniref:Pyridinium-3,5-bisthiocarboxylic acid mononucleotide nickel insertion protein n=1 Tax=Paenibacillus solanacearum TaxID=2048548 RepID=A0A916NKD6_9BACL|nr:nickel pincer cofactor biosynthesis protein LarC [Paenibacillus solanacearum]CAG7640845.1 Pyridinium-3,5-bisthiocarboxylic acid mononucleotide nickel insertion protein [Paenibacillus solanacearum]
MKICYLDCFSGISGDMTLAALVDAGADRDYIDEELRKIHIEPFALEWKRVNKRGISSMKVDVLLDPNRPPEHHRHYSEIVEIINRSGFNERVVKLSLAIFEKIAIAEAKIHNVPIESVHFHEVGAIDSIVDVIGVALAIDSLQIEKIICSPVPLGSGTVRCDHGIYPVPAPATLEMMKGLPIAPTPYAMEMTTPTGAGIVSGLADEFGKGLPPMIVESIGYGAGTRDLPNQPNVLRVVIGRLDPFLNKYQISHGQLQHDHEHHRHESEHHHHHREHTHSPGQLLHKPDEAHEHRHSHHEHNHHHDDHHHHDHGHGDHGHSHGHDAHHHGHEHSHHHEHDHPHDHDHVHSHDHEHGEHRHTHDSGRPERVVRPLRHSHSAAVHPHEPGDEDANGAQPPAFRQ